jgi:hypothetical protein
MTDLTDEQLFPHLAVSALTGVITGIPARLDVAMCTCGHEPRLAYRFGGHVNEWAHVDDETFAEMRHIHVGTRSQDCDGARDYSRTLTIGSVLPEALRPGYLRFTPEQRPDFHDLWVYAVRHLPPIAFGAGEQTIITITEGSVRWTRSTDEAGDAGEAQVCHLHYCAHDSDTQRDHTAEREGY